MSTFYKLRKAEGRKVVKTKKSTPVRTLRVQPKTETQSQQSVETQSQLDPSEKKLAKVLYNNPAIRKVVRRSAVLADFCTDEDAAVDAKVIADACLAELRTWDLEKKTWIREPDHKTRLAAATLRRAYLEGTPVRREIKITANFESGDDVLSLFRGSPEGMRALRTLAGLGTSLEVNGEVVDVSKVEENTPIQDVQKTGGVNPSGFTEKKE